MALAIGACGTQPVPPSPPSATPDTGIGSPDPSPSSTLAPGEMPTTFRSDLEPSALPIDRLVPGEADVTGRWFGSTDDGAVVLVAWVEPGSDPFLLPRGLALWRRHDSSPHWRVDLVQRHDAAEGIQEIAVSTTDLTEDGSDDALVFEGIGGSGSCGRWSVIDLARGKETYRRELCDGRIDAGPSASPGLVLTESVYREGDAHCCPSAKRETTLTWTGTAWRVSSKRLIER
jgi:hypothetical protein